MEGSFSSFFAHWGGLFDILVEGQNTIEGTNTFKNWDNFTSVYRVAKSGGIIFITFGSFVHRIDIVYFVFIL